MDISCLSIFTIMFAFFLSLNNSRGLLLSLSSMLILFALPLSALWATGLSNESIIAGLLPFSDAAGYYNDANRLLRRRRIFRIFNETTPLCRPFGCITMDHRWRFKTYNCHSCAHYCDGCLLDNITSLEKHWRSTIVTVHAYLLPLLQDVLSGQP